MAANLTLLTLFMRDSDMRKIVKPIAFILICLLAFGELNNIFLPKYYYTNSTWPTTSTIDGFYKMDKNTVDVIYLGSSVCVNEFSPQEIYNKYGIRSFNLGSEQQDIMASYFWLCEALRFQKPQVVVLDTKFLFAERHSPDMPEGLLRKCMDPMKWSYVKRNAINEICTLYPDQSKLSYYLTNFRFHTRWKESTKQDINPTMVNHCELKGYSPSTDNGPESFIPYVHKDNKVEVQMSDVEKQYLDRIAELCNENNMRLILTTIPAYEDWTNADRQSLWDGMTNVMDKYCDEHRNASYINLMEKDVYTVINPELPKEDIFEHGNLWGSIKLSDYLGNVLKQDYKVKSINDPQYEETKSFYQSVIDCANNGQGYYDFLTGTVAQ